MPTGYTFKKRVGSNTTDASTNFSGGWVSDKGTPSLTLKTGSGVGDYTTTSAVLVDIDATNLAFAVTVPVGQKVLINVSWGGSSTAANALTVVSLSDGTTSLRETKLLMSAAASGWGQGALTHIFVGDGAAHTFKLRWSISTGTATMFNSTAQNAPTMTFWMGVAN
jgi:stress response protein SCP2